jgi:t-SNARE complex subunit (syntaxin)
MERAELLDCMEEAADALTELGDLVPPHSHEAQDQVEAARQHFDYAITLLRHAPAHRGRRAGGPPGFRLGE